MDSRKINVQYLWDTILLRPSAYTEDNFLLAKLVADDLRTFKPYKSPIEAESASMEFNDIYLKWKPFFHIHEASTLNEKKTLPLYDFFERYKIKKTSPLDLVLIRKIAFSYGFLLEEKVPFNTSFFRVFKDIRLFRRITKKCPL